MSVMELLPDDVLVEVLQYVDVPDLLRCRLVCKRLQALLVRDARVWRHRKVRLDGPAAAPRERGPLHLLSLAPCLDHLYICAFDETLQALTTTECAVASLTLVESHLRFNSPLYAQMLAHQEALGRLRSVHLIFVHAVDVSGVFWDALTTCSRLESLTCNSYARNFSSPRASTALYASPVAPSLRKFSWHLTRETAPFVHAVLAGHSATLEDVELWFNYRDRTYWTDDTMAAILGSLPKLHSLRLIHPSLPGLSAVAACGTLRKLCVDFVNKAAPAVVELLRRAKQLRDVRLVLRYSKLEWEIMEALASPGLERLELKLLARGNTQAQPLLRTLPALPALRHLVLDGNKFNLTPLKVRKLLLGITPATAPALRILELNMDRYPCPHMWVHKSAFHTALIANPSLHIELGFPGAQSCRKHSCLECQMGCHKDIWKAGVRYNGILKISIHLHELQIAVSSRVLS